MQTCRKEYLDKYLRYDFQIFRIYNIEPALCDELEELNLVQVLRSYCSFSCLVVVIQY